MPQRPGKGGKIGPDLTQWKRCGSPSARLEERLSGRWRIGECAAAGLASRTRVGSIGLLLVVLLAGCGAPPAVPPALGGLPRTHAVQGDDALREISRLHGKRIGASDGFVAHYERDGIVAMLYVSRAYLAPMARWQFSRMVEGVRRGDSNAEGRFAHLKARERDGLTLYSALGLGQVHYFYRSGRTIVWLAADPRAAQPALTDTVRLVR